MYIPITNGNFKDHESTMIFIKYNKNCKSFISSFVKYFGHRRVL